MKVFLSWSKPSSRAVAEAFHRWLPDLLQAVDPWISSESIPKGSVWLRGITDELESVKFGIVFVTSENMNEPWLAFEAGAMAMAKGIGPQQVAPIVFGLALGQLPGPLSQFQATEFNREDVFRLVSGLNRALGTQAVTEDRLERQFSRLWPTLETEVNSALKQKPLPVPKKRSSDEVLDEVLATVRALERHQTQATAALEALASASAAHHPVTWRLAELGQGPAWTQSEVDWLNTESRPAHITGILGGTLTKPTASKKVRRRKPST